ncbi:MAG: asparagine synthase-related protein [Pseudomonadota bacterium]
MNKVGIGMVQLPMKSQHTDILPIKYQSYYVSYNGEIYDEAATNLQNEIEIAINSIHALKPINGMFAIAAYDVKKNNIILARDEFGIKPLYYYCDKQSKIFIACSEIHPILQLIGQVNINRFVISEIIVFGTQVDESTCFSNINLLAPGNILNISLDDMQITRNIFPELQPTIHSFDSALEKSVSACVGDTFRPASLLISDGLDSNLLLTYLNNDINKYNIIVNNSDLNVNSNQYSHLQQMHLNEENYGHYFKNAVTAYGQPCRMTSILMYQALSEYISQDDSHLVVTGEGADEMFWGYPRHLKINSHALDNLDVIDLFFPDFSLNINLLNNCDQEMHINEIRERLSSQPKNKLDLIDSMDRKFSLEPLLRRSDHLLMRGTIETRVPFLHFGIPLLAKKQEVERIAGGVNKKYLINLMKKRNPSYAIKAKQHFRAPIEAWFGKKKIDEHFNPSQLEIIDHLGISIDKLRSLSDNIRFDQVFVLKTAVMWYEKFENFFSK